MINYFFKLIAASYIFACYLHGFLGFVSVRDVAGCRQRSVVVFPGSALTAASSHLELMIKIQCTANLPHR